jgi:hypothetical protein
VKRNLLLCLAATIAGTLSGGSTANGSPDTNAPATIELKLVKVDSEETNGENGCAANAIDGDPNSIWHTQWQSNSPACPHEIILELRPPSVIWGFAYLPRQDASDHGTVKDYEFYVSDDGENFGEPVKKGAFERGKQEKVVTFKPIKCRFIKFKALSEINGLPWTSAAEIRVLKDDSDVRAPNYKHDDFEPGLR